MLTKEWKLDGEWVTDKASAIGVINDWCRRHNVDVKTWWLGYCPVTLKLTAVRIDYEQAPIPHGDDRPSAQPVREPA